MMRVIPSVVALLSLFIFPWQVSVLAVFVAALFVPPAGLILGIVADLVYFMPGSAFFPYFSLFGLASTGITLLVHRFVKTRIMGE